MNTDHSCGRRRRFSAASWVDDTRRYLAAARRRPPAVAALLAFALVVLPYSAAADQPLTAGPDYRYETKFATADTPSQFDVVQLILDFAPGAWTPEHFHGGPGFITVIDGVITRRHDGVEEIYKAGETWTEDAGDVHSAGNAGGAPASTAAIFLLSKGTPLTTIVQAASDQPPPPGPTYRFETRFEVANPPRAFDVVQLILDFRPGAWTPPHIHGGPGFITIVDGEVTRRTPDSEQVFHPGDTWTEGGSTRQATQATRRLAPPPSSCCQLEPDSPPRFLHWLLSSKSFTMRRSDRSAKAHTRAVLRRRGAQIVIAREHARAAVPAVRSGSPDPE